ncbi:MAG TPA: hypothetical protein VHN14_21820 [Kofleriaceae bacterium]|jgi:hypothetical protein|nr:hypothetical protein [Kofleriaceae bacterium]
MTRLVRILTPCIVSLVAACGSAEDTVSIALFKAAPEAIEPGQTGKLLFVVNPPDAQITIAEMGDMTDRTEIPVSPIATITYHLTATNGSAQADAQVTLSVGPQPVAALQVTPASTTSIAGDSIDVTLTAVGGNGLPTSSFHGTVHLSSSDPAADLPGDVLFTTQDGGVKQVKVALKTAGVDTLTATDTNTPSRQGTASVTVQPASTASCAITQAPAAAVAGSIIGATVTVEDKFGNLATRYAGTIRLTTTDLRAVLPPDVTYAASDAGRHAFPAALVTTGVQTLSAADTVNPAIRCDAIITVTPAAPKLVVNVPPSASAGYAVNVGVVVKDLLDNAIPNYAGTVTFTSTDTGTGAVTPAPLTFTGSEGGIASTSATFVTLGTQTVSARDAGTPVAAGSAASTVHGLVYTQPVAGRVRLIANLAQSNTQVVQLDLVANERLELSTFFGGGPGAFAVGMDLPLDTTRAANDTTLFIPGAALPAGTGTRAAVGRIGETDHVLYTAVSRKRVAGTTFTQGTEVQAGQIFYSVRLKLLQAGTVGPVFDGAQPSPLFRAAVRDQYGDDFVSQGDFGIGKLEIR